MSRYWSSIVSKLEPYVPGEQPKVSNLIKLNTKENPYGPAPSVLAALLGETTDALRLYPDPNSDALKCAIADNFNIQTEQVFVGNGSDEVLAHVFQALLKHELPILFPDITYSFYPVYCGLYQVEYATVPLTDSYMINLQDYVQANGGIIFPNPNAPTGCGLPLTAITALLENNTESVVVVDEAYIDFGGESAVSLINQFPNLLVIQTLSKSRSLAGLRVGFAMGDTMLIEALERVKNSFNSYPLDRLAIAGSVAAIQDKAYFDATRNKIIATRDKLAKNLTGLGFEVLPSQANFLFVRHADRDAARLSQALRQESIIVRHFSHQRINQFLRITIGTENECERLVEVLEQVLG